MSREGGTQKPEARSRKSLRLAEFGENASWSDAKCITRCYTRIVTISLRNLPPEIESAIVRTSEREGISLNRATIRLLEASIVKPAVNSEFDDFFGLWQKRKADAFDRALRKMRRVEPEDWQ